MRATKIVLVGAASASFGPKMIADAVLAPGLRGSTLALVDIDAQRLEVMAAYAQRLNVACDAGLNITHTTERAQALPEAEFVIISVAVRRDELWQLDFELPLRHGIKQVLGENGGPGGLSHTLRNVPIILDIARDVERLAPNALVMNFSNPESRIGLALSRYTGLRFVGLCHGIGMAYESIGRMTGIHPDDLTATAAGLNHFCWVLDVRRKSTGEDVYPLLRQADAHYDPGYYSLTRWLMRQYGWYPHPSDDHIGEYLAYAHTFCGLEGYDFSAADRRRVERWAQIMRIAEGQDPAPTPEGTPALAPSGEFAFPIIASTLEDRHQRIEAVNIPNGGLIANLPAWAVVEVPAVAAADGVRGIQVGPLPDGIAALLTTQAHVQHLAVEAAVHGSRSLALQALLADPVVTDADAAERTLDALLKVHAAYLPQFS